MKPKAFAVFLLLTASLSLHARDYPWYLSLGASAGAVVPSGGYPDLVGQELANVEGHPVFLMGPAAGLAAHGGIGFQPWLGLGLDFGASLDLPLFFGDASAWILYLPALSVGVGPDFRFGPSDSPRLRVSPRLGFAMLPLGLWEGSSFGGLSSLEKESWKGTMPSLTGLLRVGLEGGGKPAWLLYLEGSWNFTTLLNTDVWGGRYLAFRLSLGAGVSWGGVSDFRVRRKAGEAQDRAGEEMGMAVETEDGGAQ